MEPKEKALELYNYYEQLGRDFTRGVSMKEFAKLCALKVVDEIINANPYEVNKTDMDSTIDYWQEVKQELEAL